jgi:chorismate synthase
VKTTQTFRSLFDCGTGDPRMDVLRIAALSEASELHCSEASAEEAMRAVIRQAAEAGDTVGGTFEVAALNVPAGLGSHVSWERRLDAAIGSAFMGIQAIKSVDIGLGAECAERFGSAVHDPILPGIPLPMRPTNRAGGIEGGISNGEPILVRAVMKPIPTLKKPLPSVDLDTGLPVDAHHERSDVCAVPAASVVAEHMLAIVLGQAFMERFGGDTLDHMQRRFDGKG